MRQAHAHASRLRTNTLAHVCVVIKALTHTHAYTHIHGQVNALEHFMQFMHHRNITIKSSMLPRMIFCMNLLRYISAPSLRDTSTPATCKLFRRWLTIMHFQSRHVNLISHAWLLPSSRWFQVHQSRWVITVDSHGFEC